MDVTLLLLLCVLALVVALVLVLATRARGPRAEATLAAGQSELAGRLGEMAETGARERRQLADRMAELQRGLAEQLGRGLQDSTRQTLETMGRLQERLAVIDEAQKKIETLGGRIVGLQEILSNKQSRGAFGEIQLNDLVTTILPPSAYRFQATLSNGRRADCLLDLPQPPGAIAIDAKFPLDGYRLLRESTDEEARGRAERRFRDDVLQHVKAIAERYILPGETADSAIMFLPSEAVYAELHAHHGAVVEESYRRRVFIVSPTTLMATLNTVRAVLRDARLREQTGLVQRELLKMTADVRRLAERVDNLARHFGQAGEDVRQIQISAEKVARRADAIAELETEEGAGEALRARAGPVAERPDEGGRERDRPPKGDAG